jgi:hypothetical protein
MRDAHEQNVRTRCGFVAIEIRKKLPPTSLSAQKGKRLCICSLLFVAWLVQLNVLWWLDGPWFGNV